MECEREEESGEMYSPNKSGEYTLHGNMPSFIVQGLRDALTQGRVCCDRTTTPRR